MPGESNDNYDAQQPSSGGPPSSSGPGSTVVLSDVMGRDRSINIFAGFIRDVESVSNRLDNEAQNTTVLAPLNSAIEKLPRKPWENPEEYDSLGTNAYEGDDGIERANRNLRRFVEAHIIPASPWTEGEKVKAVGSDREVWWEEKEGKKVVQPGGIEVVSVASTVKNGEVVCYLLRFVSVVYGIMLTSVAVDIKGSTELLISLHGIE